MLHVNYHNFLCTNIFYLLYLCISYIAVRIRSQIAKIRQLEIGIWELKTRKVETWKVKITFSAFQNITVFN